MENTDWKIEKLMAYIRLLNQLHECGMGDQSAKIAESLEELHKRMGFGGKRGIVVKSPDNKDIMLYSSGEIKEIEVKRLEE